MKQKLIFLIITLIVESISSFPALASDSKDNAFVDVKDSTGYYNEVKVLADEGIIQGDTYGNFRPDDEITRAEFSTILCRSIGMEEETKTPEMFNKNYYDDVLSSHWAAGYINLATDSGAINGMGNRIFAPEQLVTNEQVIKMLICAWGYGDEAEQLGGYPNGYMEVAKRFGITDRVLFNYGNASKRWVASMFVYGALQTPPKDNTIIIKPALSLVKTNTTESYPLSENVIYVKDPVSIMKKITLESAKYERTFFEQRLPSNETLPFELKDNKLYYNQDLINKNLYVVFVSEKNENTVFSMTFKDQNYVDTSEVPVGIWKVSFMIREGAIRDEYSIRIQKNSETDYQILRDDNFRHTYLMVTSVLEGEPWDVNISNIKEDEKFPFSLKVTKDTNDNIIMNIDYLYILQTDWKLSCAVYGRDNRVIANVNLDGDNKRITPIVLQNLSTDETYILNFHINYKYGDDIVTKGEFTVSITDGVPDFNYQGMAIIRTVTGYKFETD